MKVSEICQGVIDNTIEIDSCGHNCNDLKKEVIRWFEHNTEYANGKGDGTWQDRNDGKTIEEWNKQMRDHYQRALYAQVGENEPLSYMQCENYCFSCGRRLKLIFRNNRLELRRWFDPEAPSKHWGKGESVIHEGRCEFENESPYGGEIEVKSSLVFSNFFVGLEDDCPEEEQYGYTYDLNCHRGRMNRAKWKLENQKVAYGQMGNMSIGIYVNKEKTSVFIGPAYLADIRAEQLSEEEYNTLSESDLENLNLLDGHELVGEISLSVWRWEASDKDNLGDRYQKTLDATHIDELVDVEVVKGIWEFTHYYGTSEHSDEVYAKFNLKD